MIALLYELYHLSLDFCFFQRENGRGELMLDSLKYAHMHPQLLMISTWWGTVADWKFVILITFPISL